jgi:hypothetical protein
MFNLLKTFIEYNINMNRIEGTNIGLKNARLVKNSNPLSNSSPNNVFMKVNIIIFSYFYTLIGWQERKPFWK